MGSGVEEEEEERGEIVGGGEEWSYVRSCAMRIRRREEELPGACRELMANAHILGFFSLTNLSDLAALVSTPPF